MAAQRRLKSTPPEDSIQHIHRSRLTGKDCEKRRRLTRKAQRKRKKEGREQSLHTEREESEKSSQKRKNCKLAGKEAHYSTGLDWTGLESKTHQAEKAEWEIKINLFHQGTSKPLEHLYLFTPLSLFFYCICPRTIQLRAPRWPALFFSYDIRINSAATLSQGGSDPLWSWSHVIINDPNRWLIILWHPDDIQFHFQSL